MSAATDKNSNIAGTQDGSAPELCISSSQEEEAWSWGGGRGRWGGGANTHRATDTAKRGEKTKLAPLSLHQRQGQLEAGGGAVWPVIKMVRTFLQGLAAVFWFRGSSSANEEEEEELLILGFDLMASDVTEDTSDICFIYLTSV